ncbi:hypothetical protein FH972_021641 [Carpinus fangiana]|uniref:Uncharacterized protein n=1 Tax=Carpinus fangiana TaxID=176857 RepID=A0A5N6KPW2_9ROSI|nr:hypothetical protein FH972_021641 [Carpinus fangiana]
MFSSNCLSTTRPQMITPGRQHQNSHGITAMNQSLKRAIRWAAGQAPRSDQLKRKNTRIMVDKFAEDPALAAYGDFIWGVIKNTQHTSHTDARSHITLHIKTQAMVDAQKARAVHIYTKDDNNEEYDGFKIFDERPDKGTDGTPGETI